MKDAEPVPDPANDKPAAQVYRLYEFGKADTPGAGAGIVVSNAFEAEDEYRDWYANGTMAGRGITLIEPPYNLKLLDRLSQENNALGPCIEAMVTNIDGTGFEFHKADEDEDEDEEGEAKPADGTHEKPAGPAAPRPPTAAKPADGTTKPADQKGGKAPPFGADRPPGFADGAPKPAPPAEPVDPLIKELEDFFGEPWPGESFVTLRKELRRDLERCGNAYLEVVRNPAGEVVFLRRIEAGMVRLVKLDEAVEAERTVRRKSKDVTIRMKVRERRLAQLVNEQQLVFFKEFGATRDLDKNTGKWAQPGQQLPAADRATEVLRFTALPDAHTPYGVPRWINQVPSVLGSRKAEEFNLDFFDNGGIPPVMILLQGGTMTSETRRAIEQKTGGAAARKSRVTVIEAEPTGGSIDQPGQAKITVERFGAERQQDSMFEKYDERAELRIRRAFRLPPIFVGQAADYSFATAYASYTVAEAQVFKPEREEFDEAISIRLLPAMGYKGYRMRSKPMQIQDVNQQMAGLTLAKTSNRLAPEDLLEAINQVVGLNLKPSAEPVNPPPVFLAPGAIPPPDGAPADDPKKPGGAAQTVAGQRQGVASDPPTTPKTKGDEPAIDLL